METTLAELILVAAAVVVVYRLLRPVQRWLEALLWNALDPQRREVIDVEPLEEKEGRGKRHG